MSMAMSPLSLTPKSPGRRTTCAAWALATGVVVGVQPVFTQVPPNRWRSASMQVPGVEREPPSEEVGSGTCTSALEVR